jgi:excisionase family DNA binding protein
MSTPAQTNYPIERAAYTLKEWCARWEVSRSTAYNLMQEGNLKSVQIGSRRLITVEQDREFERSLLAKQSQRGAI